MTIRYYFRRVPAARSGHDAPARGYAAPRLALGCVLLLLAATGCAPEVALQGLVTNIEGEPLPGVSVKIEEVQAFGVSNGNGIFGRRPNLVSVPAGTWDIVYIKTGFTTVHQQITTGDVRTFEVPAVALWPLPAAKGVYILEKLNYRSLTRVTPERYLRTDNRPVFGMKQVPELMLDVPPAYFISHKMANYDWQLTRLEPLEVLRPGVDAAAATESDKAGITETIWAAAVRLPIQALPVDLPEQLLWQIRPTAAVPPGFYALHWGALDGDATTEESIYLVGIRDPDAPAEAVDAPVTPSEAEET